jgi:hypothetical protein
VSGARVSSKILHTLGWLLLTACIASPAVAQIGIQSGVARVTLVARSEPHGSIQAVAPARQTTAFGGIVGGSMLVRFSANSGYRLVVRSTGAPGSRVWVQDVNGAYHELTNGSAITVARDNHCAGASEREVHYRMEPSEGPSAEIPVRYELAINPSI